MKIKRIHIDRFGGLKDFSLDFHDGFNLIFGNNEDGKTTIMSFLRLMFYGEVTKKSDVTLNIRRRFTPFSGERMGGEVEFTHGGKGYLLSKQFGKTPRSDRVSLIDTDTDTPLNVPAGKEIGEMFFSLSAEAFERSIYIGSLPTDGDGSAELSERLRRLAYSGEDGSSYEQIRERLQKAQLALRTPRRVGLSDKLEDELSSLRRELDEAKRAETQRNENCEQIKKYEQELDELKALREELKLTEKAIAERKALDTLRAERELRIRYAENKKAIGAVTPDKLNACKNALSRLKTLKSQIISELEKTKTAAEDVSDGEILALLSKLDALNLEIKDINEGNTAKDGKSVAPVLLFSAAGLCLISSILLLILNFSFFWTAFIPAAAFLIAAVGILRSSYSKQTLKNLENKERLLSLEEEKRSVNERYIILSERKKIAEKANERIKESKENCERLESEINSLTQYICSELSLENAENIEEYIDGLSLAFVRLKECESSVNSSPYRDLSDSALEEKLEGAKDGVSMSAEVCEAKLLETDQKIHLILKDIERTRAENEVIMKSHTTVAVIENEIKEKSRILAQQEKHFSALSVAIETLESANTDMRKGFAPELNRLTGEILSGLTGGRHSRVSVSDALTLTVSEDGVLPFSAEQLSAGSLDQAELSLRLAIAKLSGGENNLPLLLDDVLMQYDDTRTDKALKFLLDYAKENQVLLFTCHGSQKALVDSNLVVNMKK